MKRAILVSVLLSGLALCAFLVVLYTSKLHEELSRLRRENLELSTELEQVAEVSKKLDELLKSYDEIAPQVAEVIAILQNEKPPAFVPLPVEIQ